MKKVVLNSEGKKIAKEEKKIFIEKEDMNLEKEGNRLVTKRQKDLK